MNSLQTAWGMSKPAGEIAGRVHLMPERASTDSKDAEQVHETLTEMLASSGFVRVARGGVISYEGQLWG